MMRRAACHVAGLCGGDKAVANTGFNACGRVEKDDDQRSEPVRAR